MECYNLTLTGPRHALESVYYIKAAIR